MSAQVQIWTAPPAYDVGGRALNAALAAAFTLPLLLARRFPLAMLVVVIRAGAADHLLGGNLGQPRSRCCWASSRSAPTARRGGQALGCSCSPGLVLSLDVPRLQAGDPVDEVLPAWFILGGTWGLGRWLQHRRAEMSGLATRAEALERDRAEATRAAVNHERARIALHDLVAHSLAVIVLPGAGSRPGPLHRRRGRAACARRHRLDRSRRAGRSSPDAGHPGRPRPRRPRAAAEPGTLDQLVNRVRSAGLPVSVSVSGRPRPWAWTSRPTASCRRR